MQKRVLFWWNELRPGWLAVVGALILAASFWDAITPRLGITSVSIVTLFSKIDAKTWWIVWLVVTLCILFEAAYQLSRSKDEFKAKLETKQTNQALSDKMSDHYEHAVHHLLNKPPNDDSDLDDWRGREKQWRESCLKDMRRFNCTKQEKRHVQTLGFVRPIVQGQTPAITHELNMLATRMVRISDLAGKYGE